jgi:LPS-assembly lipoprotein
MSRDVSSTLSSDRALIRRRGLLGLGTLGLLGLSGCGFRPLYGQGGSLSASAPVSAELGAIDVAIIPERSGQLLRRALRERLWAGGQSSPRYTLTTGLQVAAEPEGYRSDGLPTRLRFTAMANWYLATKEAPPKMVLTGSERAMDASNIPDNQFFAGDASREAMLARLIDQLAEDIVTRLAVRLQEQPTG